MELRQHRRFLVRGARDAARALEGALARLDLRAARGPSLLPEWSKGHVLTHLARNADSHVRLLEALAHGERVDQYEGGGEGRAADIEQGALRDPAEIVADVRASGERLFSLWERVPEKLWAREVRSNLGLHPAWRLVWSRWRELAVHHVDLDMGFGPPDWPESFVRLALADVIGGLESRLPGGVSVELVAIDMAETWNVEGTGGGGAAVTVRGPGAGLLAWLLGRDHVAEGLEVAAADGSPTGVPPLSPWV